MHKQIIKIGSSLGITIPAKEAEKIGLKAGDSVKIEGDDEMLKIIPVHKIKPVSMAGLWRKIKITNADIKRMRKQAWGKIGQ